MLYMLDGLYASAHNEGDVIRFASFETPGRPASWRARIRWRLTWSGLTSSERAARDRGPGQRRQLSARGGAGLPAPSGTIYDPGRLARP
jgi:hypothetical protein